MDIIYRGNLQNLAVSKGVVELPHIRLFYLDKAVLSERRFYKQLIHINIILECAVLDSPFELTPKIEHLIYSDAFDIRPYMRGVVAPRSQAQKDNQKKNCDFRFHTLHSLRPHSTR